ncbi:MAG: ISAs1 family transposase [Isosphaeraceae bacterium]
MDASSSLMELLAGIPDPRSARGRRHPLPALLALAVVAMLAGVKSYEGFVQFGKERGWAFLGPLGFTTRWGLCKATYSRVFRRIDVAAFEAAVAGWVAARVGPEASRHLALDGKAARGSRDAAAPAAHLVAAYAVEAGAVLAQLRVDAKTNEHKAALELLGVLPLGGRVVTGDAMFTHRDVCAAVAEGGGDYLLTVKENQPTLLADIKAAFAEPPAGLSPPPGRPPGRELRPRGRRGQGARPAGEAGADHDDLAGRVPRPRLAGVRPGVPDRA